jgi:hypothetical protein
MFSLERCTNLSNAPGGGQAQQSMSALSLNCYSVPGNDPSLRWFVAQVRRDWLIISKRCGRRAFFHKDECTYVTERFMPPIKMQHAVPLHRFDARTQRRRLVRKIWSRGN